MENSVSGPVIQLEREYSLTLQKLAEVSKTNKERKKTINKQQLLINELQQYLQIERLRSSIFETELKHFNVDTQKLFELTQSGFEIGSFQNQNIPVLVHDYFNSQEVIQYNLQKPEQTFRVLPSNNKKEEKPEEYEEKIRKAEDKIDKLKTEMDIPYKEITEQIEAQFEDAKTKKVIGNLFNNIKNLRIKLLGKLKINEYTKLLRGHIKRIEALLKTKKTIKNVQLETGKYFTPLEKRLLRYGDYWQTSLDMDEIQKFKTIAEISIQYPRNYIPFSYTEISGRIIDYMVALCSIKEILTNLLVNPYGFNSIVYLEHPNSSKDDPYTFYRLQGIENGKNKWTIDCRLEEFSVMIARDIQNHCIHLFRYIYKDVFNDNIYRSDYKEKASILSQDGNQLLDNIVTTAKEKTFCDILQKIVSEKCVLEKTKNHKFNTIRDNEEVKLRFMKETDSMEEIHSAIRRMFDGEMSNAEIDGMIP